MSIFRTIAEMGMAAQGAVNIHETAKYFSNAITNSVQPQRETEKVQVTFSIPEEVALNQSVLFTGTAPIGYVEIYSYNVKEKQVMVGKDHKYYGMLFFSKQGVYELYAMYLGVVKSNTIQVICR